MNKAYTTGTIFIVFTLTGCESIYNTADSVGQRMPVIGQRCENWQCLTQSGQEASAQKIQQQQAQTQNPNQNQNRWNAVPLADQPVAVSPAQQYPSQLIPPPQRQVPLENPPGGN